jgi:hypothetical protein
MKYLIDIADNKTAFAEELFKNISFVKNVKAIDNNEITNPKILQSIEQYEKGNKIPTLLNLADLKEFINA